MNDLAIKKCPACDKEYPATTKSFHEKKNRKDGLKKYCKLCTKEKNKPKIKKYRKYKVYQKYFSLKEALEHKILVNPPLIGVYFGLNEKEAIEMCSRHHKISKTILFVVKEELS